MRSSWIPLFLFSVVLCVTESVFIRTSADVAASPYDNLKIGVPFFSDYVLDRESFALGFSIKHRQAVWVQYRLTKAEVITQTAKRSNRFYKDSDLPESAIPEDYIRSGYDRGHLAPAADMSYSVKAMNDSFSMANISPQLPGFNRGVWKRLEERVRAFAIAEEEIYVVTGVIFSEKEPPKWIGKNKVSVPKAYFKVIFDATPPCKMIAFIFLNEHCNAELQSFVVTVDQVEEITGFDFFSALPDEEEAKMEAQISLNDWNW